MRRLGQRVRAVRVPAGRRSFGAYSWLDAQLGGRLTGRVGGAGAPLGAAAVDWVHEPGSPDVSWPRRRGLRFSHPWPDPGVLSILREVVTTRERLQPVMPSAAELDRLLPVLRPSAEVLRHPAPLQATWLGHSAVLVQTPQCAFLTDPVLGDWAAPFPYTGPRRFRPSALSVDELPHVDFVLVSHNHYDHLEKSTVRALGNRVLWFVPHGLRRWFARRGVTRVVELSWWQRATLPNGVQVTCTPAKHSANRFLHDRNTTLWCSWAVSAGARVWFAGDTAAEPALAEVGTLGPFDLALVPVGAYAPRRAMHSQHTDPHGAVAMHTAVRAHRSVGIHWGTFALTGEPILEPRDELASAAAAAGLEPDAFTTLQHGETRAFPIVTQ